MSTQNVITIDDGTREFTIQNTFGKKICDVFIRPGDLSIMDRYKTVMKQLPDIVAPLRDVGINADGTSDEDAEWAAIGAAQKKLEDALNYLFGMDEAQDIFKERHPFSSVGGKFFCETVIDAIGKVIAQALEEESAEMQERTKDYMSDLDEESSDGNAGEPADQA